MTQIVVNNASYPVPDHAGRHIPPGGVAEVEATPAVKSQIDSGRLVVVSQPAAPSPEPPAPRRRSTREESE